MTLSWSIYAADVDELERPLVAEQPDTVLKTASVGKLLLLGEVARRIESGEMPPHQRVRRDSAPFVRDSGLWHALDQAELSVVDACRLVGAVSDNLATNVLIEHVGLDAVRAYAGSIAAAPMELLDFVSDRSRAQRRLTDPNVPETLSRASARSLVRFMAKLDAGTVPAAVEEWLSLGVDLSMVPAPLLTDPLAHNTIGTDARPALVNKTGTDDGIRADTGLVRIGDRTVAYAAIANWDEDAALGADAETTLGHDAETTLGQDAETALGHDAETALGHDAETTVGQDAEIALGQVLGRMHALGEQIISALRTS